MVYSSVAEDLATSDLVGFLQSMFVQYIRGTVDPHEVNGPMLRACESEIFHVLADTYRSIGGLLVDNIRGTGVPQRDLRPHLRVS